MFLVFLKACTMQQFCYTTLSLLVEGGAVRSARGFCCATETDGNKGVTMTPRELTYAVLAVLGVILPMYYNLQYMGAGETSWSIFSPSLCRMPSPRHYYLTS